MHVDRQGLRHLRHPSPLPPPEPQVTEALRLSRSQPSGHGLPPRLAAQGGETWQIAHAPPQGAGVGLEGHPEAALGRGHEDGLLPGEDDAVVDEDLASVWLLQAGVHTQYRRLAAARGTQQREPSSVRKLPTSMTRVRWSIAVTVPKRLVTSRSSMRGIPTHSALVAARRPPPTSSPLAAYRRPAYQVQP